MNKIIQILIVDDHKIFRAGLKSVLETIDYFKIIGDANNGKEALVLLEKIQPDIVLMDISMPEMNGIEATEKATKKYAELKIIGLTSYEEQIYYYKMIKAGALGFVNKKVGIDELVTAINTVFNGNNYFSQSLLRNILFNISNNGDEILFNQNIKISKREKEVLLLICQGYSNKEIAEKLFISARTVDKHRTNLLSKTATKNSPNLVMFAFKNKLIEF